MILKIYPQNPNEKHVAQVVRLLEADGLAVFPTGSLYAIGCSIASPKAVERLKTLSGRSESKLTIMCGDLSRIADYAKVDNEAFKILKRNLPGPFTFILPSSSRVPDKILGKRKCVGVRIPEDPIAHAILAELGVPMVTCTLRSSEGEAEYSTDPELMHEEWGGFVDVVVDGGEGGVVPTTVVDLTGDDPEVIREGAGELML